MPFDTLTTAAVSDELRSTVEGGRIQRILQPSQYGIALSVYGGGASHWLLLSADPAHARVHLSAEKLAKAFPTPSAFVMLLRKYLEGARLEGVEQPSWERIIRLDASGAEGETTLITEVMGKHSNIVLIDATDRILGAVKAVPPRQSRVRPILPGRQYVPPPSQARDETIYPPGHRLVLPRDGAQALDLLAAVPPDTTIGAALLGLLAGSSPFLVLQILARVGVEPRAPAPDVPLDHVLDAAEALLGLAVTREWHPTTFVNGRRPDFAPYVPVGMSAVADAPSISVAIDETMSTGETRDALATTRRSVLDAVERARTNVERRLHSLRSGLDAARDADIVMERGQLVLAYSYAAEPGADRIEISDLNMTIPLDPTLTAQQNAERLFRRYGKLREAQKRLPDLIRRDEAELQRLTDLASFVGLATTEAELRALEREIAPRVEQSAKAKSPKQNKGKGPPQYKFNGYTAVVGRSARENEEVTFRRASREDLWLHARERTGAHVILQTHGSRPDSGVVEAAAALAAYHSEGRTDTAVDVDVTLVRNVRKIPGAAPGRVTYRDFETVRIAPSPGEWVPVR